MTEIPAEFAKSKGVRFSRLSFVIIAGFASLLTALVAAAVIRVIFGSLTWGIVSGILEAIILFASLWRGRILGEAEMIRRLDKAIQPTNDPNEMARWVP